jgi:hypothetical protein
MLRKAIMVISAGVLSGLVTPQAASAGNNHGWEYGAGWGDGFVYDGPPFPPLRRYPDNYPYEGYPHIGYDGPPFFIVWDFGAGCSVWHRPKHPGWHSRTVQLCD